MLDLLFRAALAALLVAFLIPLLASSRPGPGFTFTKVILPARRRKRHRPGNADLREKWAADQFAFERAIEAYEQLIDKTTRRLP